VPSTIYAFLALPGAPSHRLVPLASTTVKRPDAPAQTNGVKVPNAAIPDFAPAAITVPLDGINPVEPAFERYKAISVSALDEWAEKHPRLKEKLQDIRMSALIFPFKASPYLVDELIDWSCEGDIADDPFYRLVFPTMAMLSAEHDAALRLAVATNPLDTKATVADIRDALNPHPAGQKELNTPKDAGLTGVQHKYAETVLFFAAAAQTCHAYCTYCFRWAQFIGDADLRFAQSEAETMFGYLAAHEEVSDVLFTGGDPMFMKTTMLAKYLEPFCDPTFLPHVKDLRIGTRALSFWPQRFTTDSDADALMALLRRVRDEGGRHFAIMAHISTQREVSTDKAVAAIRRLQDEGGCVIRSQAPLMRGINDDAQVWADKWRAEVKLGIVPYYLFVARDTGARHFFDVPLHEAQQIYADAIRSTSGLCRTARGPSMSCTPGKVEVMGVQTVAGVPAFVLRFLQCRDANWIGRVFFAKYDETAVWFDDLVPLDGEELPWTPEGLPKAVPTMPWKALPAAPVQAAAQPKVALALE